MKGINTFEIDGKERGFKFGTYAFSEACEKENCTIDELLERIGFGPKKEGKKAKVKLKALLHFFYGAAVHYADHKRQEIDFTVSDVSDWLDKLGAETMQKYLIEGLTQPVPKNSQSPTEKMGEVTQ